MNIEFLEVFNFDALTMQLERAQVRLLTEVESSRPFQHALAIASSQEIVVLPATDKPDMS